MIRIPTYDHEISKKKAAQAEARRIELCESKEPAPEVRQFLITQVVLTEEGVEIHVEDHNPLIIIRGYLYYNGWTREEAEEYLRYAMALADELYFSSADTKKVCLRSVKRVEGRMTFEWND